jgi:hypothetical protein
LEEKVAWFHYEGNQISRIGMLADGKQIPDFMLANGKTPAKPKADPSPAQIAGS